MFNDYEIITSTNMTLSNWSSSGKSVFLTNLILNIFNEYDKIYIYSPSLH